MNSYTLWTKNFTIITVGTIISMLGSVIASFATGLLVLDYTGSVFLFAIYMILYEVPRIFVPTLVGPFLDKFSRRKTIYVLDFITAGVYGIFGLIMTYGELSFPILVIGITVIGTISSIYNVAYESLYPMLVSKGNMGKAYSISSTMESLVMVMTPLSIYLYHEIGIAPLFFINMVSYLIAAIFETQIKVEEEYVKGKDEKFGISQYTKTYREGLRYLKENPGLMFIALYFMFSAFSGSGHMVVGLPYFRETYGVRGEYIFIFVEGCHILGRVLAGAYHYRHKIKPEHKFTIAFCVYLYIAFVGGTYLYMPIIVMMLMNLSMGLASMTSYNIRISATQNYVPNEKKGRFNGTFHMMNTLGMMVGELLSGYMADIMDKRYVISIFCAIEFLAAWAIMFRGRKHVSEIYNRET